MFLIEVPDIMCEQCMEPVSNVTVRQNQISDNYVFLVTHHGQMDVCEFPAKLIREGWVLKEGTAFRSKANQTEPQQKEMAFAQSLEEIIDTTAVTVPDVIIENKSKCLTYDKPFEDPLPVFGEEPAIVMNTFMGAPAHKLDRPIDEWGPLLKEAI